MDPDGKFSPPTVNAFAFSADKSAPQSSSLKTALVVFARWCCFSPSSFHQDDDDEKNCAILLRLREKALYSNDRDAEVKRSFV
jgi:hypothetical protein